MTKKDKELSSKVYSAMYHLVKDKGYASSIDVLIAIGVLSKTDYENWRTGKVDYLERVCNVKLKMLSYISNGIRSYAKQHNLKPSWTDYRKCGNGKSTRLRFSKSGDVFAQVEKLYATHYVGQAQKSSENSAS